MTTYGTTIITRSLNGQKVQICAFILFTDTKVKS